VPQTFGLQAVDEEELGHAHTSLVPSASHAHHSKTSVAALGYSPNEVFVVLGCFEGAPQTSRTSRANTEKPWLGRVVSRLRAAPGSAGFMAAVAAHVPALQRTR
jgi:hypothetical protein